MFLGVMISLITTTIILGGMLIALKMLLNYKGEINAKFNFKKGKFEINKKETPKKDIKTLDPASGSGSLLKGKK